MVTELPKILIIDDGDLESSDLFGVLPSDSVVRVHASSAAAGILELSSADFALVLLRISGSQSQFGVDVREVAAATSAHSVPLVLISPARLEHQYELQAYQSGVTDILCLPLVPEILSAKIAVYLQIYQGRPTGRKADGKQEDSHQEAKYRELFHAVDQGFCIIEMLFDEDGAPVDYRFSEVNPMFEKQTGLKNAEGKTALELVPDLDRYWFDTYGNVVRSGNPIRFEQLAPALDRIFDVYAFRIGEEGSRLVGLLFSDVTAKKRAQLDYERSVDVSPAILWITEIDGSCSYLSQRWYEYTGQTREEAIGYGWLDATHPDDKQPTADIFLRANKEQKPFYVEYRLRVKDGSYRWAIDAGNPRYDRDGKYLGYAGTVFDIHERKLAEQAAQEANARTLEERVRIEEVLNQTTIPIALLEGREHRFKFTNDAYNQTFDLPRTPVGLLIDEVMPEAVSQGFKDLLDRVFETGESYHGIETPFVRNEMDGTQKTFFVDFTFAAKRHADGATEGVLATILDVTDKVRSRKELETAKDEAERANELKSAFLANMSHEIRTPLGAMLGFADLLKDPSLSNNERSNFVDILSRNGEQLSVIINDILDISKVEAGQLTLEYADFYPARLAEETLSLLNVKAKEKDLALEYLSDETVPESIVSDPTRVRQILLNLVSNAVKFTKFGRVTIRSYGCETSDGRKAACFEVTDTGMGIAPDKIDSIFEPFIQADNSMTRRFGGTGLGLALSRQLARALGGEITILRSELNVGTTFLLKIEDQPQKRESSEPEAREPKKFQAEIPSEVLLGIRVLVVDDAPDNQALIWRYLSKYGAVIDSAENGYMGYRKALAFEFDIILMDLQMPEMDGYTATHKLRSAGFQKPIVALTAHAMSEVRQKCLNVGCTTHLPKPINARELVTTVAKLVKGVDL